MFDSTHAATVSVAALCNIVRMYGYVRLPRRLCHPAASRAVQVTVIQTPVNPGYLQVMRFTTRVIRISERVGLAGTDTDIVGSLSIEKIFYKD